MSYFSCNAGTKGKRNERGVKNNETLVLIGWISLSRKGVTAVSTLRGMSSNRDRMITTEQLEVSRRRKNIPRHVRKVERKIVQGCFKFIKVLC